MKAIGDIAINAFRESVRDKVLYNLVLFAVLMMGASYLIGQLTAGQDVKIIKDLGLAATTIFGLFIAVFIGIGLVSKEVERRSIYSLLSKPIHRYHLIVGKYLGLSLTLLVNVTIMLPHKEYVTPFGPMNALAKLLDAFHYRRFITTNHITDALFTRTDDTVDLDRGVPEMRHTLCGTLDELETKLASVPRDDRPVFGHMRALDLHIGNVWSAHAEPGESFPGFHTVYASRVHRMDACLGRFLDYLRRAGLYDDSIVVLAADHGDSLGEGLRWGHGFTVFPEVMRIPLVMHLPREARTAFTADVTRVSFAVDITPTLYALLGQTPVTREPLQGSPLFVRSAGDLTDRRSAPFLVASSYGPSYGLLSENGTRLYIADGINGREYAFDLRGSIAGRPVALTDDQRAASRREVLAQIKAIADRYRFEPRLTP